MSRHSEKPRFQTIRWQQPCTSTCTQSPKTRVNVGDYSLKMVRWWISFYQFCHWESGREREVVCFSNTTWQWLHSLTPTADRLAVCMGEVQGWMGAQRSIEVTMQRWREMHAREAWKDMRLRGGLWEEKKRRKVTETEASPFSYILSVVNTVKQVKTQYIDEGKWFLWFIFQATLLQKNPSWGRKKTCTHTSCSERMTPFFSWKDESW